MKKLPTPQSSTFSSLINDIEKGRIKIPQFQRDFVWDMKKSANLIDSIVKGYPIGTFIFWRTKERLRTIRNIGGLDLPEPPKGDFVNFVLDGQQRLTSLFASLKGLEVVRGSGKTDDFSKMYIDLTADEDEQIILTDIHDKKSKSYISINDLLYGDFALLASYPKKYGEKLRSYKQRVENYSFSIISVEEAPLDIATEIFTRINVGGKSLTLFEIMVAKTYDNEKNFDLAIKFDELIERLRPIDYDTISDAIVLQTISLILEGDCTRKQILKLKKAKFIETWYDAIDAIERAIEYFRNYYRIPVSQLLPYNALIVPFAYFFYHHKDKPTDGKEKYLTDYFWRCALSRRFSSGAEAKLAQDIKKMDMILTNQLPKYDWSVDTSPKFIKENGTFSSQSSYTKAILCIYAYREPKSFIDDSRVNINNNWLKQANSKNYHHFFPKAFLKKNKIDDDYANHIANITIVDDYLNKRQIASKSPKVYMKKFMRENPEIDKTMKTHLITNIEKFGILENDYETFIDERVKVISRELKKRIIEQ